MTKSTDIDAWRALPAQVAELLEPEHEDQRRRRAAELAALLVREPAAARVDIRAAAEQAGWQVPRKLAALACVAEHLGPAARILPADALSTELEGTGCILFPDPSGPGRAKLLERAAGKSSLALGPPGPPSDLSLIHISEPTRR